MSDFWENLTFQNGLGAALDPFNLFGLADQEYETPAAPAADTNDVGNVTPESVETQAAQRKLARLSKYFTSPSGVLDDANIGSQGVF